MNSNPVFLLGAHKSGTSLLRSLFDGVGGFYTIPIESHPFELLQYGIRYPYRKQLPKKITEEEFIENSLKWINYSNLQKDKYADSLTPNWFDEVIFKNSMKSEMEQSNTHKEYIESYFKSIFSSSHQGNKLAKEFRFVEKSVENAEFALDLSRMFPNSKFIHIIRNPYSNLVSLRKYKGRKNYPYLDKITKALFESYYFMYRNEKIIENYKVIKYEDLVSDTHSVMKEISNFLETEYSINMVKPSINNGQKWEGNSVSDRKFSGVSNQRLNRWERDIYGIEIEMVNRVFPHILERFNYEKKNSNKNIWTFCKKENFKTYAVNRLLLKRHKVLF
jgi:hypothetical protein